MKRVWIFSMLILFSIPLLAQKSLLRKELINIDGQKVTAGDFLKMYEKNGTEGNDTTSLSNYLQLYINFRLKVLEAEKRGMDTLPGFKKELNSYRKQLARPYFTDKQVTDSLVKQAYQRLQYDIRASHILVRVSPNASPADTLKAWKKINHIRSEIIHGMDFEQAAVKYSEDPSARDIKAIPGKQRGRRGNHGDLGYFTVFNMVYPFEEAAYNTPVDSVSKPIRTRFGYHLIKVTDKRPAMGVAEVEHIFVALKPGYTKADSLAKAEKIQKIYQKIKAGMPFEEAARKYSEDRGSAGNGGKLPRFSSSRIVPQFVEQIDSLKPGQISKPFQTIYGFHIIKLLDRKRPGSFKQEEPRLKEQVARDQRARKSKEAVLAKIKKEHHLRVYQDAKAAIFQAIDTTVLSGHFKTENLKGNWNHALMEIGEKEPTVYVQEDFARFVEKNQHKGHYTNKAIMLDHLFKQFVDQNCLDYENQHLEDFYPDFKALMQEYHDGILLFNLMDQMVWTKAMKDTTGLKKYYTQHREKYKHGTEAAAYLFSFQKNELSRMDSIFKQYPDPEDLIHNLKKLKIKRQTLKIDSGTFQHGDNRILDTIPWKPGYSKPIFSDVDNRVFVVYIKEIISPGLMSFDQAKGLVASDYQDLLEKNWVTQLRAKYPVKVNEKVLNKLIKYEKEKKK
ncbi:peptidylprolyl isomerase [Candidatus Sulfidibacterium hydrothermale]|uniref:peptidylprolyl isomerase n=1 Tax=Candidatus Sulfidibacterium hydrothermale TaxID=2875962 RepID=UPI001F0A2D61|nr:peptidylprolyl isomerase [Candidatus Sulfidibacterium hydrothermale]UBM63205.1 peptidylprolyl isomerase [Candidatus Sulfidibacterium hydrothermale]